jgi:hypothetical protein
VGGDKRSHQALCGPPVVKVQKASKGGPTLEEMMSLPQMRNSLCAFVPRLGLLNVHENTSPTDGVRASWPLRKLHPLGR